ncbi:MAG: PLP-dependent aminotransferase family protein [Duodenibacillus sp.]|nr:PLP-dependent aminotransferase family protein [Duodenibacillus sp.]
MTVCNDKPFPTLSKPASGAKASVIREILKVASRPEVISFAGGLPNPAGFPVEEIGGACSWVLENRGRSALQYSLTEGEVDLRRVIAERETERGCPTTIDEVQIVSGSQQALDLIARAFIDPGSRVLVENPTYLGALQAFRLLSPEFQIIPTDARGLNPDALDESCRGARFAYVMPTFANPTGLTIDDERRRKLAEKAREYDFWLVEDDPYGELWYNQQPPKSLRAYAPERTLRLGTLSKVLAPGFRLGYICGRQEVLNVFTRLKQAVDLHTATFTQQIAAKVMGDGLLVTHLPKVRALYKAQCQCMLDALDEFMPKHPDIKWTRPEGGMFIWMQLPSYIDSVALGGEAVKRLVAFVPGTAFYADEDKAEPWHLRLSFVTVPPERIRQGVQVLAALIAEQLR